MSRAGVTVVKALRGSTSADGKRSDGFTMVPRYESSIVTWDTTVTDTIAVSYITLSSAESASAAEVATLCKAEKYAETTKAHLFFPLAYKTLGPINCAGQDFISGLGA